jgi:hypothetical protein
MLESQTTVVTLKNLLNVQSITVYELLQQPNILDLVKADMRAFVEFCQQNEQFTKTMIKYGIATPMELVDNEQMRTVVQIANSILIDDSNEIAEIFIIDDDFP